MNEKRVIVASVISLLFMVMYSGMVLKPSPSIRGGGIAGMPGVVATLNGTTGRGAESLPRIDATEETVDIESGYARVRIGARSGVVREITLGGYEDSAKTGPLIFGGPVGIFSLDVGKQPVAWSAARSGSRRITMEATSSDGTYEVVYELEERAPVLDVSLRWSPIGHDVSEAKVTLLSAWWKENGFLGRQNQLETVTMSSGANGNPMYKRFLRLGKSGKSVPRGTRLLALSERYFCQVVQTKSQEASGDIWEQLQDGVIAARIIVPWVKSPDGRLEYQARVFFGARDYFELKKAGFEEAFPIGLLGKIGLILLSALNWIAGMTGNYGLAIVIFAGAVTCIMAPFTLMGFKSMKKMQELKPKLDIVMAKHKSDPKKANQEIFELYREHRVSPWGGCLPVFLQMPIFIALLQAMTHYVRLRGQGFLWIKDLSLPDKLATIPWAIPILGHDINALPVVMAVAMYVQTKITQQHTGGGGTGGTPGGAIMNGPLMSVLFGVMFYNFPSGLVLYWLTNSLVSMAWYKLAM